jgi:hypothetical protein
VQSKRARCLNEANCFVRVNGLLAPLDGYVLSSGGMISFRNTKAGNLFGADAASSAGYNVPVKIVHLVAHDQPGWTYQIFASLTSRI